jgi:hypothetical protein
VLALHDDDLEAMSYKRNRFTTVTSQEQLLFTEIDINAKQMTHTHTQHISWQIEAARCSCEPSLRATIQHKVQKIFPTCHTMTIIALDHKRVPDPYITLQVSQQNRKESGTGM